MNTTSYITGKAALNFGITAPSSTAISLASRESGVNFPGLIVGLQ